MVYRRSLLEKHFLDRGALFSFRYSGNTLIDSSAFLTRTLMVEKQWFNVQFSRVEHHIVVSRLARFLELEKNCRLLRCILVKWQQIHSWKDGAQWHLTLYG